MFKDLAVRRHGDDVWVLNGCNDPHFAASLFTLLYVNGEYALQALSPGHGTMPCVQGAPGIAANAP